MTDSDAANKKWGVAGDISTSLGSQWKSRFYEKFIVWLSSLADLNSPFTTFAVVIFIATTSLEMDLLRTTLSTSSSIPMASTQTP